MAGLNDEVAEFNAQGGQDAVSSANAGLGGGIRSVPQYAPQYAPTVGTQQKTTTSMTSNTNNVSKPTVNFNFEGANFYGVEDFEKFASELDEYLGSRY